MLQLVFGALTFHIWTLLPLVVPTGGAQPCTFNNAGSVSVVYCESDCCDNTCCANIDGQSSVAVVVLIVLAAAVGVAVAVAIAVVCCKGRLHCRRYRRDKETPTVFRAQDKPRDIDNSRSFHGGSLHSDQPARHGAGAVVREGTFSIFA